MTRALPSPSSCSWDLAAALGERGRPGRWDDWRAGLPPAERNVVERAESPGCSGSRVTVIDFHDCGYSWFLYDLAASVSFLEHRHELPQLIDSWLEGYHAETEMVRSLGTAFAADTVGVADRYLSARLLDGVA